MATALPPTTTIADVAALHGRRAQLTPPLRVASAPMVAVSGAASTVTLAPGEGADGLAPLYELLSTEQRGRVLVIGGAVDAEGAVFGQILARAAASAGFVAAIIEGAIRDVGTLPAEGLAVVCQREHTVGAAGLVHVAHIGTPLRIAGMIVSDADVVVVDCGGAVALEAASAQALLDDARALAQAEERVLSDLADGVPLRSAYAHKREATREIRGQSTGIGKQHSHRGEL